MTLTDEFGLDAWDAMNRLIRRAQLRRALTAIEALPERPRDVFILHRFEGMTYTQISDHLGISTKRVERHMARAIGAVHSVLEGWS